MAETAPQEAPAIIERPVEKIRAPKREYPGALIVVEEATNAAFAAPEGFTEIERRRYDDSELVFLRLA